MKKIILLIGLMLLAGCGDNTASNRSDNYIPNYIDDPISYNDATSSAGSYVESRRNSDNEWEVSTSTKLFGTYTSLTVMAGAPVTTKVVIDPATQQTLGTLIISADKSILVRTIHKRVR